MTTTCNWLRIAAAKFRISHEWERMQRASFRRSVCLPASCARTLRRHRRQLKPVRLSRIPSVDGQDEKLFLKRSPRQARRRSTPIHTHISRKDIGRRFGPRADACESHAHDRYSSVPDDRMSQSPGWPMRGTGRDGLSTETGSAGHDT